MFKTGVMVFLLVMLASRVTAEEVSSSVPATMQAMRSQVEAERGKEQELQLLQLEVERLKLEVEKKKAMAELGKISGEGGDGAVSGGARTPPSIRLRYVFIAAGRKEAFLDVNGVERRVQEGHEVAGQIVKVISAEGVSLKAQDGTEFLLKPGE